MLLTATYTLLLIVITHSNAEQSCQLTESDILGPYYIEGAPRSEEQLCANLPTHDRLVLTGQIVDYDSQCLLGIPYVKLDLWQANYNGVYSSGKSASDWFCRGVFLTDVHGRFRVTTLIPGRYDDNGYRPAHIHFNITVEGYPQLVTQLYFNQDYYLAPRDSCDFCRSESDSLRVSAVHHDDIKTFEGDWNIVLSKTPRISPPTLSRSTDNQGSYIHLQEHIMRK